MKRLAATLVLGIFAALSSGGCVIRTDPRHRHGHVVVKCKPSQYWDGHHCRHKGKGHGARKHDD